MSICQISELVLGYMMAEKERNRASFEAVMNIVDFLDLPYHTIKSLIEVYDLIGVDTI